MLRVANVAAVFRKELRELLRDRRSLLVMFGVPLLLYPLLFAGLGKLAQGKQQQQAERQATLVVTGSEHAPELMRRLTLPERRLKVETGEADDQRLRRGEVDAVIVIPPEAEARLIRPAGGLSATRPEPPTFSIRVDRSRTESDEIEGRLRLVFTDYERWVIEQRLASRGVESDVLEGVPRTTVDVASRDQVLGRFLAQLLPLMLLVTGMLGALFPALNATTTERELGTLETLLVTPVSRGELLMAKGLLVLGCGVLTAALNMASMSLVLANLAASAREQLGGLTLDPGRLTLAFVSSVPALVLFSSLVLLVGLIARTYREANSYAGPVMLLPMLAMVIAVVDPPATYGILMTPVANTTVVIRDILTDRITAANFAVAAGANLLFAAVVLSVSARLFTNEQLVNPSWEPLSFRGLRKGPRVGGAKRQPTIDEALLLIAMALLIQFYAGPWFGRMLVAGTLDPLSLVALLLAVSFLLPTLLLSYLAGYDRRTVLALRVPETPLRTLAGAALLGLGLAPLMTVLLGVQNVVFDLPITDAARSLAEIIGQSLQVSPTLAVLTFGIVPGVCEELLFRGVVLAALRKRLSTHAAVWITAGLFAAAHLDVAGLLPRTLLGAALGYLVCRSGSVLPAMLLHAVYNGVTVGVVAFYAPVTSGEAVSEQTLSAIEPLGLPSLVRAGVGLLLVIAAAVLLRAWRDAPSTRP